MSSRESEFGPSLAGLAIQHLRGTASRVSSPRSRRGSPRSIDLERPGRSTTRHAASCEAGRPQSWLHTL
eukprot:4101903-Pyramimonas_sp.AAC.1